ncbi:hypothetical protein FQP85_20725 [Pseudoalteromonas neustonica]|uniref:Uncharacterized protein n=1 Tax=Pseudoalteromonas neustonica TaxID=1840331 RepID=A0ABY3F858_9GAMM|nr:hypothetical protein [Pseudoalteromonas neustonica]TVU80207.1 hypothetical protein FQP85_20725 [Pseudoalteromonas neustonica]
MDILEKSLAAAEAMLDGITPEEFEKEYLSIRNGIGPLAKSFIDNGNHKSLPLLEVHHYRLLEIDLDMMFSEKMKRIHRSSLVYGEACSFHQSADYDYSEAA